ncbi:DnaA ATPase domain-containing protein [Wolbachia endosymbiont of Pentidionis agamae]|uniref:DnaA ATPase domain-containing protein n=1 Tax=Wolbachia endosymbiont of Pentidionis agamae TaxID=3110435 RepID=UPI002FD276E7
MQLNLFTNHDTDYSINNYILLEENKQVYNLIINDYSWKNIILYGPKGSGKTHISHIWQELNNASFIDINNFLDGIKYNDAFILEDIQNIEDEEMLFHCFNYVKENSKKFLITSSIPPKQLNFKLNDLSSRILSVMSVKISPPSDELLKIILIKQFADRQLKIDIKVVNYIISRMERSFHSFNIIVQKISEKLIEHDYNTGITIPFVRSILEENLIVLNLQ